MLLLRFVGTSRVADLTVNTEAKGDPRYESFIEPKKFLYSWLFRTDIRAGLARLTVRLDLRRGPHKQQQATFSGHVAALAPTPRPRTKSHSKTFSSSVFLGHFPHVAQREPGKRAYGVQQHQLSLLTPFLMLLKSPMLCLPFKGEIHTTI